MVGSLLNGNLRSGFRVEKLRKGKGARKDEVTGEIVSWKLCNMALVNGVMLEEWRSAVDCSMIQGGKKREV